jgi:hypothetical protein
MLWEPPTYIKNFCSKLLMAGEDKEFMAIAPDTIDETMLEIVCAK